MMTLVEFQQWLNEHGAELVVDGKCGPKTRGAIEEVFTNTAAAEVNEADLITIASRLGCSVKQLKAVALVESGGSAFDKMGRPKILFERHKFYKLTKGKFGKTFFSNPNGGGYEESSWTKLKEAACCDPAAAFGAASWGKFQVLGMHWQALGYESALELAYSTVQNEANHYHLLARFIEANKLQKAMAALSTNPEDNVAFAEAYNGPNFKTFNYDTKLAKAMK